MASGSDKGKKGIALVLGPPMGGSTKGPLSGPDEPPMEDDDNSEQMTAAASSMMAAVKQDNPERFMRALRNFLAAERLSGLDED